MLFSYQVFLLKCDGYFPAILKHILLTFTFWKISECISNIEMKIKEWIQQNAIYLWGTEQKLTEYYLTLLKLFTMSHSCSCILMSYDKKDKVKNGKQW